MKSPLISFVIPSHDSACWLAHAIKSCLDQTYTNLEVLVVDDFSQDSTKQLLGFYLEYDKRVRAIYNPVNLGRSASRNIGNKYAQGEIICVLDADDYNHQNRAKLTLEKFKDGSEMVYGSAEVMDALGKKLGELRADVFNKEKAIETLENRMVHSSLAYTKDLAMRFPYREELSVLGLDDWGLEIEAALSGVKIDFIPQTVVAYRILNSAVSQTRDMTKVMEAKKKFLQGLKVLA